MRDLTALGGTAILTLATFAVAGFFLLRGKRASALYLLVAVGGGLLLSTLAKEVFARPRPDLVPHGSFVHTASFPSGHSMLSAVTYLTLGVLVARTLPQRRLKVYVLSLAYPRHRSCRHQPRLSGRPLAQTDVLAGLARGRRLGLPLTSSARPGSPAGARWNPKPPPTRPDRAAFTQAGTTPLPTTLSPERVERRGGVAELRDCIIAGGGPAGLTAAIFLARFRRHAVLAGRGRKPRRPGFQGAHNHPAFPEGIRGTDLLDRMRAQAAQFGAEIAPHRALRLSREGAGFRLDTDGPAFRAPAVLLATVGDNTGFPT